MALSVAQRRLSSPARELRRRTRVGRAATRTLADGSIEELSVAGTARAARRRAGGAVAGGRRDRVRARSPRACERTAQSASRWAPGPGRTSIAPSGGLASRGEQSEHAAAEAAADQARARGARIAAALDGRPRRPAWTPRKVAQAGVRRAQQHAERREVAGAQRARRRPCTRSFSLEHVARRDGAAARAAAPAASASASRSEAMPSSSQARAHSERRSL